MLLLCLLCLATCCPLVLSISLHWILLFHSDHCSHPNRTALTLFLEQYCLWCVVVQQQQLLLIECIKASAPGNDAHTINHFRFEWMKLIFFFFFFFSHTVGSTAFSLLFGYLPVMSLVKHSFNNRFNSLAVFLLFSLNTAASVPVCWRCHSMSSPISLLLCILVFSPLWELVREGEQREQWRHGNQSFSRRPGQKREKGSKKTGRGNPWLQNCTTTTTSDGIVNGIERHSDWRGDVLDCIVLALANACTSLLDAQRAK